MENNKTCPKCGTVPTGNSHLCVPKQSQQSNYTMHDNCHNHHCNNHINFNMYGHNKPCGNIVILVLLIIFCWPAAIVYGVCRSWQCTHV